MNEEDKLPPLHDYQMDMVEKLKSLQPAGVFPPFTQHFSGGFRRGELMYAAAHHKTFKPLPERLVRVLRGEEGITLLPEDRAALFGYKTNMLLDVVLKDPVLRERYMNANHLVFDIEAGMDNFDQFLNNIGVDKSMVVIDSMDEYIKPKVGVETTPDYKEPQKTKPSRLMLGLMQRI